MYFDIYFDWTTAVGKYHLFFILHVAGRSGVFFQSDSVYTTLLLRTSNYRCIHIVGLLLQNAVVAS